MQLEKRLNKEQEKAMKNVLEEETPVLFSEKNGLTDK
jgi:hypothetical protein